MQHLNSPQAAKAWCQQQRKAGHSIGFVATMGALHQGHLNLVERAVAENTLTVASIFVNPLQFNQAEDLEKYPRQEQQDFALLEQTGCDMVFTGAVNDFFPEPGGLAGIEVPSAGRYAEGLEGQFRPGHLEGSREIVSRLFSAIGPCRSYFGEKDFQQAHIIKELAASLHQQIGQIEVVICPTTREASGLAMSSRNLRLSESDKAIAANIYRALSAARQAWQHGERQAEALRNIMRSKLNHPRIKLEYAELRDPDHWSAQNPSGPMQQAHAFVALGIGGVRLIDNMSLSGPAN